MELPANIVSTSKLVWPESLSARRGASDGDEAGSIAIVTAFFDIDRGAWDERTSEISSKYRRSVDHYFASFRNLAAVKNELIVFTSPELAGRVVELRKQFGVADQTVVIAVENLFGLPALALPLRQIAAQMTEGFRDFVWRPTAPEFNKADYVLVNALKTTFVCTAIDMGAISERQIAWIDFGYAHADGIIDPSVAWNFDFGDRINLFSIFALDDRPVYQIVRGAEVYFQGCHIVGPASAWPEFNRMMSEAFKALIACNLIDDDQTMLLMAYRANPDFFAVRRHAIDPEFEWRFIFRRFQQGQEIPVDQDLPDVWVHPQPSWLRDLKNVVRRRLRRMARKIRSLG
jgi:protein YibB